MAMSFLFSNKAKSSVNSVSEKPKFLTSSALVIYPFVAGKLHQLSQLPPKNDVHEWLATNSLAFFNQVNVQVGAVAEVCTATSCPTMTAGKETFEWLEDRKSRKTKLPAKQFIDASLSHIQKLLQDEKIFPTKFGYEFPVDFIQIVRKLFRTYFAILAHIYHHHFQDMQRLGLHDGLNSLFLHFVYFVQEFSLLEPKELQCMEELISKLIQLDQEMQKRPINDEYSASLDLNADKDHS